MNHKRIQCLALTLLSVIAAPVFSQDAKVDGKASQSITSTPGIADSGSEVATPGGNTAPVRIDHFNIIGNTLLDSGLIERVLNPYKGESRGYNDIQRAMESLEGEYRKAGYSAVYVVTPEQEITNGSVTFRVIEAKVGKVILNGNKYYDGTNIRNALPALVEGHTSNTRQLSENIRLAQENPTRQIDVVLAQGDEEDTVNAQVNVQDSPPERFFVTLDNTGSKSTGMYRTGIGFQHNNLFNRDQAATFNYVTSPGHVKDVTQLSASYRFPFYELGDSLDLIAARSDTNAGSSPIVGGFVLAYSGKGSIFGVHYNHYLPRVGDHKSNVIVGLDYRAYYNNCTLDGTTCAGVPDMTILPLSLTYGGNLSKPAYVVDYATTIVHNLPGGSRGGTAAFDSARTGAKADYTLLRMNGGVAGALPQDYQYRMAGSLQYTRDALVAYESFGLVGANAVRGYLEREVSNDKGIVLNFELYSPELAPKFGMKNDNLRLLCFLDRGRGWKVLLPGEAAVRDSVGSAGVGLRYAHGQDIALRFDLARVAAAGGSSNSGDTRGVVSLVANW